MKKEIIRVSYKNRLISIFNSFKTWYSRPFYNDYTILYQKTTYMTKYHDYNLIIIDYYHHKYKNSGVHCIIKVTRLVLPQKIGYFFE